MGTVFDLARESLAMHPAEIEKILESPIHEARAGGDSSVSWTKHAGPMPRTFLRYSIEHLDKSQREWYLNMKDQKKKKGEMGSSK